MCGHKSREKENLDGNWRRNFKNIDKYWLSANYINNITK